MSKIAVDDITDAAGTGAPNFPNGATGLPDPFGYTAVSGATQELDVGSHNFFDAGTLTADTTVSFSNVPTEARWTYTFTGNTTTTFDTSELTRTFNDLDVKSESSEPHDLFFKPDGTKLYIVGAYRAVWEYHLAAPWDVTSASYIQKFGGPASDLESRASSPRGLTFKPDGTSMFIMEGNNNKVLHYTLSTAWDISTASFTRELVTTSFESGGNGLSFRSDGLKLYLCGSSAIGITELTLSTAWNISTASVTRTFNTSSKASSPQSVIFNDSGTKMYFSGNGKIYTYTLSTAWNISTASFTEEPSASLGFSITGFVWKDDGKLGYATNASVDSVTVMTGGQLTSLTLPSSIENPPTSAFTLERVIYDFFTADGGTTVTLIDEELF